MITPEQISKMSETELAAFNADLSKQFAKRFAAMFAIKFGVFYSLHRLRKYLMKKEAEASS
jgi:hypothetical protein